MYCRKCGTENQDGAMFCKKCGCKLNGDEQKEVADIQNNNALSDSENKQNLNNGENSQPDTVKMSQNTGKKVGIICGVLAVIIAIIVVVSIVNKNKDYKTFKKMFENKQYSQAVTYYDKAIRKYDNDAEKKTQIKQSVSKYLLDKAQSEKKECNKNQDKYDYKKGLDILSHELSVSTDSQRQIEDIYVYILAIKNSQKDYSDGLKAQKNKQYLTALKEFNLVTKEDKNYSAAQNKRKDVLTDFKNDILKKADEYEKEADAETDVFDKGKYYEEAQEYIESSIPYFDEDTSQYKELKDKDDYFNQKVQSIYFSD